MSRVFLTLSLLAWPFCHPLGAGEKVSEKQALQGTWEVVSAVHSGKESDHKGKNSVWGISESHLNYPAGHQHGYAVHPEKSPKWFDLFTEEEGEKFTLHGIYSLEGDLLKICINDPGKERATKFQSEVGSGHHFITLKRVSKTVKTYPKLPEKEKLKPRYVKADEAKLKDVKVLNNIVPKWKTGVLTIYGKDINFVSALAFSPDGKVLAAGNGIRGLWLWDVKTGEHLASLEGHTADISCVKFSPDGKILASSSLDTTIHLWDLQAGKYLATLGPMYGSVYSVDFSPDGKAIAIGGTFETIKLRDVATGKTIRTFEGHTKTVYSVVFSPDGKLLASAGEDNVVRLWDVQSGQQVKVLKGHTDLISSLSFSPNGKLLASSSRDKTIRLWNVRSKKHVATLEGHTEWVHDVTFHPSGKRLLSGSWDETFKLWDVETRKVLHSGKAHGILVHSVAYSPDGRRFATGGWDSLIHIWTLAPQD
jgi:uncharacterized protein (TIGR03067 family)